MRAAVYDRFGPPDVVRIEEVPAPVAGAGEILVRVRAATVSSGDARVRALRVPRGTRYLAGFTIGFRKPKLRVLGFDFAGDVIALGAGVTRFRVGDRVAGSTGFALGCHVELRVVAEAGAVVPIPAQLGYGEAAALLFGGGTALHFLRRAGVGPGKRVLVNGASGAVGVMAVQLARHFGAQVTGVTSAANADLVRGLGAERVIDYAADDFARSGETWDIIMDTVGNAPFGRVKPALAPDGRFVMVVGTLGQMLGAAGNRRIIGAGAKDSDMSNVPNYTLLTELAAAGTIRPVIGRTFPFGEIVAAHAYVDSGRKVGAAVVEVG